MRLISSDRSHPWRRPAASRKASARCGLRRPARPRENHGGRLGGDCRVASPFTMTARGLAAACDGASCGWTLPSCPRSSPLGRAGVSKLHAPVRRLPRPAPSRSAPAGLPEPYAPVLAPTSSPSVLVCANRACQNPMHLYWRPPRHPASASAQTSRPEPHAPVRCLPSPPNVPMRANRPGGTPCTCTVPAPHCDVLVRANRPTRRPCTRARIRPAARTVARSVRNPLRQWIRTDQRHGTRPASLLTTLTANLHALEYVAEAPLTAPSLGRSEPVSPAAPPTHRAEPLAPDPAPPAPVNRAARRRLKYLQRCRDRAARPHP